MPFYGLGFVKFASDGILQFGAGGAVTHAPAKPTISAGSLTSSGATLTGSAFSDADVGDTHAASQWQVTAAADTGYASPVIATGDDATNKTSYAASGLSASTAYIARVRYKDSAGNYSDWSDAAAFTTASASQFADDFSSLTVDGAKWTTAASSGTGHVFDASSGAAVIGISGGTGVADLRTVGAFSLDDGPLVFRIPAVSNPVRQGYFSLVDLVSGKGFGIIAVAGSTAWFAGVVTDTGTPAGDGGFTYSVGDYIRFSRSGANYVMETSPDGSTWTVQRTAAFPVGMSTTALTFRVYSSDNGFGGTSTVTLDDVVWS